MQEPNAVEPSLKDFGQLILAQTDKRMKDLLWSVVHAKVGLKYGMKQCPPWMLFGAMGLPMPIGSIKGGVDIGDPEMDLRLLQKLYVWTRRLEYERQGYPFPEDTVPVDNEDDIRWLKS